MGLRYDARTQTVNDAHWARAEQQQGGSRGVLQSPLPRYAVVETRVERYGRYALTDSLPEAAARIARDATSTVEDLPVLRWTVIDLDAPNASLVVTVRADSPDTVTAEIVADARVVARATATLSPGQIHRLADPFATWPDIPIPI